MQVLPEVIRILYCCQLTELNGQAHPRQFCELQEADLPLSAVNCEKLHTNCQVPEASSCATIVRLIVASERSSAVSRAAPLLRDQA